MLSYTINRPDTAAMKAAKARWDAVAKPLDSLGLLENVIIRCKKHITKSRLRRSQMQRILGFET